MTENEIRHQDIDNAAAGLTANTAYTAEEWNSWADTARSIRTRNIYRRCAALVQARLDLTLMELEF